MSKRKRVNAMNEAHARQLCLQGRGPVYFDGVEYEFRLVPDGQSEEQALEELRDAQASVPVEDQIERVCGFRPSLAISGVDHTQPLWDEHGTPTKPHKACPLCDRPDEIGSHLDAAWCCECGWAGSLTKMHEEPLILSNADRDAFIEALENPPQPNAALRAAKERHESDVVEGHVFEGET